MKRKATALLLAILVGGCIATTSQTVESWPPPRGDAVKLNARYLPLEGSAARPAVLLLHGCGGWHGDRISTWGSWFQARGYHVLQIDSFGSRGFHDGVCQSISRVSPFTRVSDAYGALAWLGQRPEVDADRVVMMGFSHGGSTGLAAVSSGYEPKGAPEHLRFRAAVLLYPGCSEFVSRGRVELSAPTQIVVGEKDDWTPAAPCVDAARNNRGTNPLTVQVIPGAAHAFDMFAWNGRLVSSRTVEGHLLQPDQRATEEARNAVETFLESAGLPSKPLG